MIDLFRFFFLTKEIKSKKGELHFQRYRLFWTPWFALYVHRILKSDEDLHPHSHPWNFLSFILSGSYREKVWDFRDKEMPGMDCTFTAYDTIVRRTWQYHKIEIIKPVTSLVFVWGKNPFAWGYYLHNTTQMAYGHEEYRKLKNEGKLPQTLESKGCEA